MSDHGMRSAIVLMVALVLEPAGCALAQEKTVTDEIRKSFRFTGSGEKKLVLDNINGSINVIGTDGDAIELVAKREIEAESGGKIDEAKKEVTLDIKEEPNRIVVYVDAPWRTGNGVNYRGWHYYGYDVQYDFDLKIPRKTAVYLKTVNHGTIFVKNVEGNFEVSNVNGGIEMVDIIGAGDVTTVNGAVNVSFVKNPRENCAFRTVNGKIKVNLQRGLDAEISLKTFNGKVYTDFDVVSLPRKIQASQEKRGGRTVYRRGGSYSVRAGSGGPEFSFDTLNGNIYILQQE